MKKYIALLITLVMLIASMICSVFFANKWIINKNKVIDLSARVEELNKQLENKEDNTEQVEPETIVEEKYKLPLVEESNLKIKSENYTLLERRINLNYSNLSISYQPIDSKNIRVYFENTRGIVQEIDIGDKVPVEIKAIPSGIAVDNAEIVILFEDGTISYTSYNELNRGEFDLHDITLDKKAIGINQITLTNQAENRSINTAAAILEDGSSVELQFNVIEN